MTGLVAELRRRDVITALDAELARSLAALGHDANGYVALAIALGHRAVRDGHVRLDLRPLSGCPIPDADGEPLADLCAPPLRDWIQALRESRLIAEGAAKAPLVLHRERYVYLARLYDEERALAARLRLRAAETRTLADPARGRRDLCALFGPATQGADMQRLAACVAALRSFAVITGGPGTGKTTTILRIVALLLGQIRAEGRIRPRVLLLAPTGKAAARLGDAAVRAIGTLPVPEDVAEHMPRQAITIHRALGPSHRGPRGMRRLSADLVVVDEASMVDLDLMSKLLSATAPGTRLVLVGDPDQLASVEAGAVLTDIAGDRRGTALVPEFADALNAAFAEPIAPDLIAKDASPLTSSVVHLVRSHRFTAEGGIGELAAAVRAGHGERAMKLLEDGTKDVRFAERGRASDDMLRRAIVDGYRPALTTTDATKGLAALGRFRVLCAHRHGPNGVEATNAFAEQTLQTASLISPLTLFYAGRPILVTRNDHALGLFNGDVGMVVNRVGGSASVVFAGPSGELRHVSPGRLPPHETAFAMSIHKSQGSEFDGVAVILPEASSRLLTRELLYTALTRARLSVLVLASREAVTAAVARRVRRDTGLSELLHGNTQSPSS